MTVLDPEILRHIESFEDVIEFLTDELDWPIGADDLEDATFDWDPEELGIPADRVPHLASLRQLRPLESAQPWGIFFLEFDGPRLPLTALRRLLDKLVTKKRASGSGTLRTWKLDDLLFIITTSTGDTVELHFIAFFEQADKPAEIRSIPWRPGQSPAQHLRRIATELLPRLAWPDDPNSVDEWREDWRAAFTLRHGEAIRSTTSLVDRMATTARRLRDDIHGELLDENGEGPFNELLSDVRSQLVATATSSQFADMCAQTLVYGALTSRVTAPEAFGASPTLSALPLANPFLSAFFEEVHDHASQLDLEATGLEQLVADLKASNVEAILDQFGSTAKGGDPVIHFYEDFLASYDPEMRIQAGAFYTPQKAVQYMVRLTDAVLVQRLGLADGAASTATWGEVAARLQLSLPAVVDPDAAFVSMLDPAVGTGTFLVEWIRQARKVFASSGRLDQWPDHAVSAVLPQMRALELMLAPYAVAHLKVALELHESGVDDEQLGILLSDTLQRGHTAQLSFEPDAISVEGERADDVKANERITVCIGNPPYDRVTRDAGGGWITDDSSGRCLFDDLLDPAIEHTIFSHHASLYNKFVYFWRWALWKVFEDRPGLPGVVTLIAPSSWLNGPGFLGLRRLVRQHGDEIWVVDLAGDNRGMRRDENIFEIETPVAIVTVCRSGAGDRDIPAVARYRRITGTRAEKLSALGSMTADDLDGSDWAPAPNGWFDALIPPTGGDDWNTYPLLTDLFPWQQPGCKYGRTWPIAPSTEVLEERWRRLVSTDDHADRALCFVTPSSGRNIDTTVGGRRSIADEPIGAAVPPIVRYGYRSFDRQWTFDDPRLANLERPSLWTAQSPSQIFLVSKPTHPLGKGPAATATVHVPDLDSFRGSYGGKDVFPLYRDVDGTPNVFDGTLDSIRTGLSGAGPLAHEDLFAYCYGLLSGTDYTERFEVELETPGPRVPITVSRDLFSAMASHGRTLVHIHTFGERFPDHALSRSVASSTPQVAQSITEPPASNRAITYDPQTRVLVVGDGVVEGVSPEVWAFEVSGMQIVKKWLGYRTASGAGRSASSSSPLDHIRPEIWPTAWTEELLELLVTLQASVDLLPDGVELLNAILEGPLISADELPEVPPILRQPPGVSRGPSQDTLDL